MRWCENGSTLSGTVDVAGRCLESVPYQCRFCLGLGQIFAEFASDLGRWRRRAARKVSRNVVIIVVTSRRRGIVTNESHLIDRCCAVRNIRLPYVPVLQGTEVAPSFSRVRRLSRPASRCDEFFLYFGSQC